MLKTKKRLTADLSLDHTGGWGRRIKHNDNDWKFQKYKGTNLDYDMISESVNYDQEEKEGDVLKGTSLRPFVLRAFWDRIFRRIAKYIYDCDQII